MATQEPTEAVSRQEASQTPATRRIAQNPMAVMRRMLDELDVGAFGWSPASMMRRMLDDMERLFETGVFENVERGPRNATWAPGVEIRQHEKQLVVCVDLPGVAQDQIEISAEDGSLVIEGERARPSDELLQSDRAYGRFRRVIPLPQGLEADQASARFVNGVLEISLPMAEEIGARKIEIGAGEERREPPAAMQEHAAQPPPEPESPSEPAPSPQAQPPESH